MVYNGREDMTEYHINLFFSEEDQCWIADLPDFEYCSAVGHTPQEALEELLVAKEAWLQTARETGVPIPVPKYRPVEHRQAG